MCGDSEPNALGWAKRIDPCLTRDKPATKINHAALLLDVETYPDASQYERAQRMGVSARGIGDALKRAGFSYKKTFYHPKIDVQARKDFQTKIQAYEACGTPIIYVDESGFSHDMPRLYGY
ncbi:IS630 transposase-related protein [Candidatus Fukatsuia endosymbiont of Tuberolachnus salignus]|uniref:IS630 transposase-related protein n=1 Tax=Candidatus Fukatsuia endosymbiont of Tuberolachnus salignus TaxID=3077957 RepID=UPI00313D47C1